MTGVHFKYRTVLIYTVDGVTRETDTRYTYCQRKREADKDNRKNVRLYGSASTWIEIWSKTKCKWSRL